MPLLGLDTITLLVPTITVDSRDNTNYYTYIQGGVIRNCNVQPFLMTEKFQEEFTTEREGARTYYRVFAPWTPETEQVNDRYKILFAGVEYDVHSLAGRWQDFRGMKNHIAFLIKRIVG